MNRDQHSPSSFRHDAARTAAIVLTCILAAAQYARATEYFVDYAAGADANAGTSQLQSWSHAPGDPAATGVPAGKLLLPGDIVTFRGGVQYNGSITLSRSGTAAQRIHYRGVGWGSAPGIIDGQHSRAGGFTIQASFLRIEGFEIRNMTTFGIWHDSQGSGSGLELVSNRIHDIGPWPTPASPPGGSAMYLRFTQGLLVQGNEHYNSAGDSLRVFDSTDAIIRWNNFRDGQIDGIMGGANGTLVIDGNTIHGFSNYATHGDAMQIMQGDTVYVSNNLLYDNTQNIYFDTYASGMVVGYIYNNIVANTAAGLDGQQGFYNGIVIDNRYHAIGALYVYENTLVDLNSGSGGFRNMGTASGGMAIGTVELRNNVFLNSLNNVDSSVISSLGMDYNSYFNEYRSFSLPGFLNLAQYRLAHPLLEQHSIAGDPLLDAGNLFTPTPASPVIDRGSVLGAVNGVSFSVDFRGSSRPAGAGWDMGALEYAGSATPPAPPSNLRSVP